MTVPATPDDLIRAKLREVLEAQPWWKRSANTVTTALGGLVVLAWWVTTTGVHLPDEVTYGIGVLLFAASVVGVKKTPNGLTPSLTEKITAELSGTIASGGSTIPQANNE